MATVEEEQVAAELRAKIAHLSTTETGENLKIEMQELKKAILANPSASALLHDEDIGIMIDSLRRIQGIAIASATAKKSKSSSGAGKKASAKELAEALSAVSDDELE